jgi:excisionase family DNA binding protein
VKKSAVVVIPSASNSNGACECASILDPSQILTLSEVAERLKVSQRWIYEKCRRRCQNPLPVIRIGRYLRFNWLEVSAWLYRQSTGGAA